MNSITRRWMRGSLFITLGILLVVEFLFLFFMVTSYQKSVQDSIEKQLNTIRGQLSLSTSATPQAKDIQLRRVVEQFEFKDKFELMLVDYNGNIVSTSSGILPVLTTTPQDIQDVVRPGSVEQSKFVGKNENGEDVMAVTVRTPYSSDGIVAMRMVTSLELVNRSIGGYIAASIVLMLVVMLASVVSGLYFIRSIVMPLQKVEATASKIAEGDFDTRIDNKSNDEIGSLCKTINNMAKTLGQNERMKNDFISSVSHELRTPLTSIKGWTETVGSIADPTDANFRRGVEIIANETDRLYDMVEELLDFSRMQNGLTLVLEKLDLAAEVEEAVLLAEQRAALLGIELQYDAPELPVPVMGDKNRVRQVLVNVMDNAIKYSQPGDIILLETLCRDDMAEVRITDEGRGIAEDDLESVKQKFYKGKGAVRGSGIGLAVVDEIVRAHGGRLHIESELVESELGEGTSVALFFPLVTIKVQSKKTLQKTDAAKDEKKGNEK